MTEQERSPEGSGRSGGFSDRRARSRRREDLKLLQRERELDATQRICTALSQHIRIDELVKQVLQTALDVIGADAGSVLLAEPKDGTLVFRHVVGAKSLELQGRSIPWDRGIAGEVFQSGKVLLIQDAPHDPRHFAEIDQLTGFSTRDVAALPLKSWGGEPIGVLEILNKRECPLDSDDIAILTIVSAISAQAIEQAWLFEEAKVAEVVHRLADIGHDVKNMMAPIVMGAGLIESELAELFASRPELSSDPAAVAAHATCLDVTEMQRKGAQRVLGRMKEFVDCAKGLNAGSSVAPCDLAEITRSVIDTLRLPMHEKGVTVAVDGLDTLPAIEGDERRLYNAIYNLVNNAIPEVPRGGSIRLSGAQNTSAGEVMLTVSDTGRGMSPVIRDSLFTVRTISTKPGGSGLGTKIVKDVIDAHNGRISVESEEGRGTTFRITLPIQPPTEPPQTSGHA